MSDSSYENEIRKNIVQAFEDYCFGLGPYELVNNFLLLKLIESTERLYIDAFKWDLEKVSRKIEKVFEVVEPTLRFERINQKQEELVKYYLKQLTKHLENAA